MSVSEVIAVIGIFLKQAGAFSYGLKHKVGLLGGSSHNGIVKKVFLRNGDKIDPQYGTNITDKDGVGVKPCPSVIVQGTIPANVT